MRVLHFIWQKNILPPARISWRTTSSFYFCKTPPRVSVLLRLAPWHQKSNRVLSSRPPRPSSPSLDTVRSSAAACSLAEGEGPLPLGLPGPAGRRDPRPTRPAPCRLLRLSTLARGTRPRRRSRSRSTNSSPLYTTWTPPLFTSWTSSSAITSCRLHVLTLAHSRRRPRARAPPRPSLCWQVHCQIRWPKTGGAATQVSQASRGRSLVEFFSEKNKLQGN
jgi:hypothetical protein